MQLVLENKQRERDKVNDELNILKRESSALYQLNQAMTASIELSVMFDRILQVLPHRPPFLFVERLVDVVVGERANGLKTVSANEEFLRGHFH